MPFAHQNRFVHTGGHLLAEGRVERVLLAAQLHHARGDDDAPPREAAQHPQRSLRADGVGVERVVDDRDARAVADVKIVVHRFAETRFGDDDRNVAAVLAAGDKADIDAGLIRFRGDGDVFGIDAPGAAGVLADIESALGPAVLHAGDDLQKRRIDAVELAHFFASP